MRASAHDHTAAAGPIAVNHAFKTVDIAAGWEIWRRNELDQLVDGDFGFQQQRLHPVDHLAQVMRWDVRRHAHGNTGGTVNQKIRKFGRQNGWF